MKKKKPDLRVTLLERGPIPTGASTRNAGFACFGSLSEVVADARSMGTDRMLELVEMRYKGVARIRKQFSDRSIGFELSGGYELYQAGDTEELRAQMNYINSLLRPITGQKQTYRLADEQLRQFRFGRTGTLVYNALEGALHSGHLIQRLLALVQGAGVQVFTQTQVEGFIQTANGFTIETQLPVEMQARQLLLCTNAFTRQLLPGLDIVPARGQVLLTSPIEGLPFRGTFHADEGYYYFRNLGDKVLLGGARNTAFEAEATDDMNHTTGIQATLEAYLEEVVLPQFKGQYVIERRWAGIMAMGSEKMPIVQEVQPGVYCAVRMSGMGVALAPVVARTIVGHMLGGL